MNSSMCLACKHKNESEQSQIYLEMEVPPDGSKISEYVEELINMSSIVQYHCQDGCQSYFQAENRTQIKSNPEFLIIILRRSIMTENGPEIVENNLESISDILIRLDSLFNVMFLKKYLFVLGTMLEWRGHMKLLL